MPHLLGAEPQLIGCNCPLPWVPLVAPRDGYWARATSIIATMGSPYTLYTVPKEIDITWNLEGKRDTSRNISCFIPLHFMLYHGKSITFGTVYQKAITTTNGTETMFSLPKHGCFRPGKKPWKFSKSVHVVYAVTVSNAILENIKLHFLLIFVSFFLLFQSKIIYGVPA